jgi:HEAT repeat protein
MSPARVALLISFLAIATHPLPAQTPPNPIPEAIQKACDPNYKPYTPGGPITGGSGGPTPYSVALCEHGIDTSEQSLITALSNSDPIVRSLAANQLLAEHDYQARPAIEKALSSETDDRAKVGIAFALAGIGDPVGAKTLESMCSDASLPVDITVMAVRQIAMTKYSFSYLVSTEKCADVVLSKLDSVSQDYQRIELLSVLPSMIHDVPKDKADRMVTDAQNLLVSKDVGIRMQASMALTDMGSTASIEAIRSAMERETIPALRAVHQRNLDKLLKLQQQGANPAPANPPH